MLIDSSTEFGKRVEQRLRDEQIGWIVTVGTDGTPQPSPVWFLWDGSEIFLRSQPDTKVRNVQRNPRVALHLDGDGRGGDIVVLTGTAHVELAAPEPPAAYVTKYQDGVKRLGMTPEALMSQFSVAIHITPAKVRGHWRRRRPAVVGGARRR